MKFNSIMHVSFHTENLERIREFYEDKLGLKPKMIVRFGAYKDKKDSAFYKMALTNPDDICIIYIEIAPGQFVEFFPKWFEMKPKEDWNTRLGYGHFALLVDDIHETRDELVRRGVEIDVEPNIGNSHTWQMWIHDPDGNRFEIMQYTEDSFQLKGNC
ncbi:VOC family protein [uncultured Clostridium sp.]|jgi:catechol 2,3-dioxygenase-like lactoylglutathione lyase family enzyme|uniref:VOC family protein n=1 Tax=uncultured Clostridium sp. TaxID=59620 RepID=UPI0028EBF081|nr:VOC family protein [uncultured Clostridium sp.]